MTTRQPSPEGDRGRAAELAERLLFESESVSREGKYRELDLVYGEERLRYERLFLDDVRLSVSLFWGQVRAIGESLPCVLLDEGAPVPVDVLGTARGLPQGRGKSRQELQPITAEFLESLGLRVGFYSASEAEGFIFDRLTEFLRSRLKGPRSESISLRDEIQILPPSPGLSFTVETLTHGLRVHYSAAYFFNPHNVFGSSLTSPVDGWIQPGRYVFGVAGGPYATPTFDTGEYDIPPHHRAVLSL